MGKEEFIIQQMNVSYDIIRFLILIGLVYLIWKQAEKIID